MAKFGFMSKALAGAGQGLQLAGQLGFQAKLQGDLEAQRAQLLSKRDEVLQRYEGGRLDRDIAARASEGIMNRATQEKGFKTQKESHLEGIDKQLSAKDNKPILIPKGAVALGVDGKVLYDNGDGADDQLLNVPEGTKVIDKATRKEVFSNPKDPKAEGLPKTVKDIDDRIKMYKSFVDSYMGIDFLAKLDPESRPYYAKLMTEGMDQIRNNIDPEKAFRAQVEAFSKFKSIAEKSKDSDKNTKANDILDKFSVPPKKR